MLSNNAVRYTLNHLLAVALPADVPLRYSVDIAQTEVVIHFDEDKSLALPLFSEQQRKAFLEGTAECRWMTTADAKERIPLFPAGDDHYPLPYDIITPSFVLLSRQEELAEGSRDVHNRFPYIRSLAAKYGFVHLPLVDEYAMLLRQWILKNLLPDYPLLPRKPQLVPTHDVDILFRFQGFWQACKSIFGRDLLINRRIRDVRTSLHEYRRCRHDAEQDPYVLAIRELIQHSQACHLQSVFFFKALHSEEPDCTYNVEDRVVRTCVENILAEGMEVGLHGSYDSYADAIRYGEEKSRLEQVLRREVSCGRQHYLRFLLNPSAQQGTTATPEVWGINGLRDDYSLGFAEQPGFRCGTCHPYLLYDFENDCPTNITEHPLILMDGTLWDYLKLDVEQCNILVDRLRARCRAVEGDFVILWHNHSLGRNYKPFFQDIYLRQLYL